MVGLKDRPVRVPEAIFSPEAVVGRDSLKTVLFGGDNPISGFGG